MNFLSEYVIVWLVCFLLTYSYSKIGKVLPRGVSRHELTGNFKNALKSCFRFPKFGIYLAARLSSFVFVFLFLISFVYRIIEK